MKRFFDLLTTSVLALIAIMIVATVLSTPIDWLALSWMVISSMWVIAARLYQLIAEDCKHQYSSTLDDFTRLRAKHRILDIDYQNLTKRNKEIVNENTNLHEHIVDLTAKYNEAVTKYNAAVQELELVNQKPATSTPKMEYTEQYSAKALEEMEAPGQKSKKKKRGPDKDKE